MKKYILLEIDTEIIDDDEVGVTSRQLTLEELSQEQAIKDMLADKGWGNSYLGINTTDELGPMAFVGTKSDYHDYYKSFPIHEETLELPYDIRYEENLIFSIEISLDTLKIINPILYEKYHTIVKRFQTQQQKTKAEEERKRLKQLENKQKRKERELERAKALLVKAGIKVQDDDKERSI